MTIRQVIALRKRVNDTINQLSNIKECVANIGKAQRINDLLRREGYPCQGDYVRITASPHEHAQATGTVIDFDDSWNTVLVELDNREEITLDYNEIEGA